MRTLIAGFGSIGRRHLRNLKALGETDFVLLRSSHSTLPLDEIAGIPVESDLAAALAHQPDAVVIANPTALHLEVAIPAAKAGCSILMEKPLSHSLERVDELRAALQSGGGKLLVGFQFRFHPGLRKVDSLLKAGEIGRPLSVRVHWGEFLPNWHPWEDYRSSYAARPELGGGVVLTLSHPLDYLLWLMGNVQTVSSFGQVIPELEIPVNALAEINLRFASGATGSVHLDYIQQPPAHTLEVIGTAGTIRWDNADGALMVYRADQLTWEHISPPEGFDRNWLFMEEARHLMDVAHGKAEPLVTLEDGVKSLVLTRMVLESQDSGKTIQI